MVMITLMIIKIGQRENNCTTILFIFNIKKPSRPAAPKMNGDMAVIVAQKTIFEMGLADLLLPCWEELWSAARIIKDCINFATSQVTEISITTEIKRGINCAAWMAIWFIGTSISVTIGAIITLLYKNGFINRLLQFFPLHLCKVSCLQFVSQVYTKFLAGMKVFAKNRVIQTNANECQLLYVTWMNAWGVLSIVSSIWCGIEVTPS